MKPTSLLKMTAFFRTQMQNMQINDGWDEGEEGERDEGGKSGCNDVGGQGDSREAQQLEQKVEIDTRKNSKDKTGETEQTLDIK